MGIQLRDARTQRLVMASIVGGAILYVYFLTNLVPFTFKARAAEIKTLAGQYREMSSEITKAKQTLNSLPYLEKESQLLHSKWEKAQKLLPDKDESAPFLRAVTLLGDKSGIEFVLFRPLPPQAAQYYTEHPIELKVEGGYNQIGTFLGEMANMERIVTISELEIESVKGDDAEKPASASFIAKTYTLGGTGVPPDQADAVASPGGAAQDPAGKKAKANGNAGGTTAKAKAGRPENG